MAEENVTININGRDNASPVVNRFAANLRQMGENVQRVGRTLTMALTVPIMGGLALMTRFGNEAYKTVSELRQNLNQAIASGNQEAINEAQAALDALSPSVIAAADAWKQLQEAVEPVREGLRQAGATMLQALVPVVQQLVPLIMRMVDGINRAVTWFSNLDVGARQTILTLTGIVAALGPVLLIVGQAITFIGSLATILPTATTAIRGFGAALGGMATAAAPILALAGAIALLIDVLNRFGPQALTAASQLGLIVGNRLGLVSNEQFIQRATNQGLIGRASGGYTAPNVMYRFNEMGQEYTRGSNVIPAYSGMSGGGGVSYINLYYSPAIGLASNDDIARMARMVQQSQRRVR